MTRKQDIWRAVAVTLAVVVIAAALVPLCTMRDCRETSAAPCSDFKPACDNCPQPVMMKHAQDDAAGAVTFDPVQPAPATDVVAAIDPVVLDRASALPAPTPSPPPLDPLGVRLTV